MSDDAGPALVWCSFPDAESAAAAADRLLDEGLIACANLIPGLRSLYVWQGAKHDEAEVGMLFKTNRACLARLTQRLAALHPYDAPAILGWHCDAAAEATAAWLGALPGAR